MDWLKKILEAQGLSEVQIKAITEGVETNYKGYVPEHRFTEVNDAKKQAEEALKDRDKQLTDIKKSVGDNEDLKKQIETLQTTNKETADKYSADLKDLQTNTALKLSLAGQVHDADLVSSLLDKTKIELDDQGNVKAGLEEQLKALQTSKAFLFVEKQEDKGNPFTFKGTKPAEGSGGKGDEGGGGDFGKRLAEEASKGNEGLEKARDLYFE